MHSFLELSQQFEKDFSPRQFPESPANLYDAAQYILGIGGKRVRPVAVLMANELFAPIAADALHVAKAIELFHNFSLIHDDIMDEAPIRRGMPTVHTKYGQSTALLSGDVMLVVAYEHLNKINESYLREVFALFSKTAREVCEGQQLDMDYEKIATVDFDAYMHMITLKTSVLLAACMQLGALIGGASLANQEQMYAFGKNIGIAFQIQDDYLDAFGNPEKFGKQVGGDIIANKKTFLLIHALNVANDEQKLALHTLINNQDADKVEKVLEIYKACKVDEWSEVLKEQYLQKAMASLEAINVLSARKTELEKLARFLLDREA